MAYFLSCDWGTSSLRISLADATGGQVLAAISSGDGIAGVQDEWQLTGRQPSEKAGFYLAKLKPHIAKLSVRPGILATGLKLVISGMASSSIGFADVPYSYLPLTLDGAGINALVLPANDDFEHDVLVVGGVRTANDVIRGEETQLLGSFDNREQEEQYFIFPGTHSKHMHVKDGNLAGFKTYMTGELFSLLANHSILKNSVEASSSGEVAIEEFKRGLDESLNANVLNTVFHARTNQLFALNSKHENFDYLSGLLIGAELNDLSAAGVKTITLIAGENLSAYYGEALNYLFPARSVKVLSGKQAAEAVVKGQLKIAQYLKFFA
jgi:2-dehydro-3-deoxygalactonokinase